MITSSDVPPPRRRKRPGQKSGPAAPAVPEIRPGGGIPWGHPKHPLYHRYLEELAEGDSRSSATNGQGTDGAVIAPGGLPDANSPLIYKNGAWIPSQYNARLWLTQNGIAVRHDTFSRVDAVDGVPVSDGMIATLKGRIEADLRVRWGIEHIHLAIAELALANPFNPVQDWLKTLSWDGEPRLDVFFARIWQSPEHGDYARICARILFGSAVARAFQPGAKADAMVILQGRQGVKKSSALRTLLPDEHPEWFAEDLGCDMTSDKVGGSLRGKLIIELGELNRVHRGNLEAVKQFLSQRADHYKLPYDRYFIDQPRTCTFVGTTNNREPLIDEENRRFYPVECPRVGDLDWIVQHRDQLWAEALVEHNKGVPWWVDTCEVPGNLGAIIADRQGQGTRIDDLDGMIADNLKQKAAVNLDEVLIAAGLSRYDKMSGTIVLYDRYDRAMQTRIGNSLARIGYVRDRSQGWKQRKPTWTYKAETTL